MGQSPGVANAAVCHRLRPASSLAVMRDQLKAAMPVILAARQRIAIGDLARYLMVSRQHLSDVIGRIERDAHVVASRTGTAWNVRWRTVARRTGGSGRSVPGPW